MADMGSYQVVQNVSPEEAKKDPYKMLQFYSYKEAKGKNQGFDMGEALMRSLEAHKPSMILAEKETPVIDLYQDHDELQNDAA